MGDSQFDFKRRGCLEILFFRRFLQSRHFRTEESFEVLKCHVMIRISQLSNTLQC